MAIERYSTNHVTRTDIMDPVTPHVFVQPDIVRPQGEWKPASWLPILWKQSNTAAGEDGFVHSIGKPVAFDATGRLVPAGLRTAMSGTGSFAGTVLSYTADDVTYKTTNLVTGEAVSAAISYTGEQVVDALIERGLLRRGEVVANSGAVPATTDAHVTAAITLFISQPVGIAAQNFFTYAGTPENGDQKFSNYNKQHLVQFFTEHQLRMPHRVAGNTAVDVFDFDALDTAGTETYAAGIFIAVGDYWNAANFGQLSRYEGLTTASAAAFGLANQQIARNTDRTPVTCDRDGVLVRERGSVSAIAVEGDFFLDYEVGVLFLHTDTFATLVALGTANTNFGYSFYTDTGTATSAKQLHFDGPCVPGDFIVADAKSNFTKAATADLAAVGSSCGRVVKIIREPRHLMQHVKSAWNIDGMGAYNKMPGSATKGFSTHITFSGERVADEIVEVVFRAPM